MTYQPSLRVLSYRKTQQQPQNGTVSFMIRPYEPRDQQQVIHCITSLQNFERTLEPDRVEPTGLAPRYLHDLLARTENQQGGLLVAEEAGQVVGYVALCLEPEPADYWTTLAGYAYISDLVVLPEQRGRGLGRALLAEAEHLARRLGANALKINVLARNSAAWSLYRSAGFRDYEISLLKPL
jgi:ribosomal protein S18 acetylase RimI-like enzyme